MFPLLWWIWVLGQSPCTVPYENEIYQLYKRPKNERVVFVVCRSGDNLKSAVFHSFWNTQEPRNWKQVLRAVSLKAKTLYFENEMMSWKFNAIVTEMEISARVSLSFQVWRTETLFFYAMNDKIYSHEVNGNCELFRKPKLVRKWNLQMKSICFCQWWCYVKCKNSTFLWGFWFIACEEKCLYLC